MPTAENQNERNPYLRSIGCLVLVLCFAAAFVLGLDLLRRQARQEQHDRRQRALDAVKQGNSSGHVMVMDSKLLPMLANDSECKRIVTRLDFFMTEIDESDAEYVAELSNVTEMTFYCTSGTKALLQSAQLLPVEDLYFEMPGLLNESYLMLKDFAHLRKVRFEHVMDDEWIERLESELPNVIIDAPFPLSKEPTQ